MGHLHWLEQLRDRLQIEVELQGVASSAEGFAVSPDQPVPVLQLESAVDSEPQGRARADYGFAAVEAVLRAGTMCVEAEADGVLTPPIHKQSMHLAGYPYEGQTQILGELCRSRRYGMLACAGRMRVLPATRHMSLRQALERLEPNFVAKQIRLAHEAARDCLALAKPRIVLAALNPHAGEGGAFGNEENTVLRKAIVLAKEQWGFETHGPAVPDVVFREAHDGQWDIVIALYHDQAFIPLKLFGRREAYSLFVGGPILRTSPLHGAAYDIAGQGSADAEPLNFALQQLLSLCAAHATAAERDSESLTHSAPVSRS